MPDIIELTPHQVRWMASKVGMEDLSFYIENMLDGLDWGNEYKSLMEKASVDGKTYILPVSSDPLVAFYNAPVFETLGLQPPSEGWTWDDFLSLANRLKDEGHIIGLLRSMSGGGLVSVDNIEPIIKSLGGQYISSDDAIFDGFLNSPATEQAFELYIKHFGSLLETDMLWSIGQTRAGLEFPALGIGRASQMYRLLDQIDPLEKLNPINRGYELVQMPSLVSGERFNTSLVTGIAMTNVARDKGLAWELMQFIVGEDNEHPMQLVTETPLMVAERRFHRRPPEKLSELLQLIRAETNEAIVSSLAMVPTYIHSNVYNTDPSQNQFNLWRLEFDTNLSDAELTNEVRKYLIDLLESVERMRDEMIENGFAFPQRDY